MDIMFYFVAYESKTSDVHWTIHYCMSDPVVCTSSTEFIGRSTTACLIQSSVLRRLIMLLRYVHSGQWSSSIVFICRCSDSELLQKQDFISFSQL